MIEQALEYATRMHAGQVRKYTGEPYIVHCVEVASLVKAVGGSEAMQAAALLHDVVEDTDAEIADINDLFGYEVAELVGWLTDVSQPEHGNRARRKEIDRTHTSLAPPHAKTIKLADLISNSVDIVKNDPNFAKVYMKEKLLLLPHLLDGEETLFVQALDIVAKYYNWSKQDIYDHLTKWFSEYRY